MRKIVSIVTICFVVIAIFSGCSVLQKLGLQKNDDEIHPVSSIVMNEDEAKKLTDKLPIHLYFANEDNTKLKLEVRYIPVSEAKKSISNLASMIVKELIKGPSPETGLNATVPAGTELRGPVSVNAGVATVDLSKTFIDKHPGGKTAEQLTIYSIVNSLTEVKEIEKVKFLIGGKEQKDFKGSFQFNVPFPRTPALISRVVTPAGGAADAAQPAIKQEPEKGKASPSPAPTLNKTPDPKTNNGKPGATSGTSQNPAQSDEDAEATYLEILE